MMHTRRRDLLLGGLAAAVAIALPAIAPASGPEANPRGEPTQGSRSARPLRILVMGGTGFLGPHFVEAALSRGHALTLFNRGKTNPERFDDPRYARVEQLQGDRKEDLSALDAGQHWDAVLDTSAYVPADVTRSARLLGARVDQYVLVSTVSVYARNDIPDMDESAPLITLPDPSVTEVTGETYGGLKALCEQAAEAAIPGKVTVVRPGLIVGPGDTTDRFTYWPARAYRGGEILAPGDPQAPTQFIDVRDLAAFLLHLMEQGTIGTFNADAPSGALDMGAVLAASQNAARSIGVMQCLATPCPQAGDGPSTVTWVPADFLAAQGVSPWQDMPAWIPAEGEYAGFGRTSSVRAQAAGLGYRPLQDTVGDTLAWWRTLPESRRAHPKAGISPEREAEVLKAWHASEKG